MTFKYNREVDMGRKLRALINNFRLEHHEKNQCIQRLTTGLNAADVRSTKLMQEIEGLQEQLNGTMRENEHYALENGRLRAAVDEAEQERLRLKQEILFNNEVIAEKDALLMDSHP